MNNKRLNLEEIQDELGGHSARDLFSYMRFLYLAKRGLSESPQQNKTLDFLVEKIGLDLGMKPEELWGSQKFQLLFRATKSEHLEILGIAQEYVEEAKAAIHAGRVMSLLPFNAVMGETTIRKYIPSRPDKFSGNWRHSMDPYGLFRDKERVVAQDTEGNQVYLATRKFPYAVLANITEACFIGCDGCYKGSMVRTALSSLADIYPEYAEIKKQLSLDEERAIRQSSLLTRWLNKNAEVDTVVISGGEPLLYANQALEKILERYKHAEHVKVVRICTSAVFQGMWYRVDEEFARILKEFEATTGKQVYINAHVTDEYQLSAPEAKIAVDMLQRAGISVHLQMPLQEGINFKRDDLAWSVEKLKRITKQAYALGVIPYKLIVDMHSPSHPDLTVPLETVTKLIGFLDQHSEHSDHERWQAYNILHEQGNLYLAAYPHFAAVKKIDEEQEKVIYYIPKVEFNGRKNISVHTYEEPLIRGQNDDPHGLNQIADAEVRAKIDEVRMTYDILREKVRELENSNLSFEQKAKDIGTLENEFYKVSEIIFTENSPLMI
ncbi:MAG: hypothetical protein V1743_07665 [Nanoarchaeota archaeon]